MDLLLFPSLNSLMLQTIFFSWCLTGCLSFLHRNHTFESSLSCACCAFLSPVLGTNSYTTLFTCKQSPALHNNTIFHSKTLLKLKSRLGYELLHSALQPTFPSDNKELFICITFPHLRPILLPAVHFHSTHLLFLHYSTPIRYGTSLPKIPNFNLVKKPAD